jgi:hypothetical protein
MSRDQVWKNLGNFVDIRSPWLRLIGEKLEDNNGNLLEYWRVEKDDSVVIITLQNNQFLFPSLEYRPGIGKVTLDFPGGRVAENKTPIETIPQVLKRELGVNQQDIILIKSINSLGWEINSSFSNQRLYGFIVELAANTVIESEKLGATYPHSPQGINELLTKLTCLQCRGILLQWLASTAVH